MDEDTADAAWAQLDLEARRWEEAIAREHAEFLEWMRSTGTEPRTNGEHHAI